MSDTTEIAWCDSTFNPWIGCTKIGPGCDNCYAEADFDKRKHVVQWGAGNPRHRTASANWKKPEVWNRTKFYECPSCHWRGDELESKKLDPLGSGCPICGTSMIFARRRVFCASLADVFDNEVDSQWRADLIHMIEKTPNIDWLLLTKRIGNVSRLISEATDLIDYGEGWQSMWGQGAWPGNVWLGITVVNQEEADRDIPKLLATPARIRFLSMEPLLNYVDIISSAGVAFFENSSGHPRIDWVITGGESGPHGRPSHPQWFRDIRDQCAAAGVPYLHKQNGEFVSVSEVEGPGAHFTFPDGATVRRTGKKLAGRTIDGVEHNDYPVGTL